MGEFLVGVREIARAVVQTRTSSSSTVGRLVLYELGCKKGRSQAAVLGANPCSDVIDSL